MQRWLLANGLLHRRGIPERPVYREEDNRLECRGEQALALHSIYEFGLGKYSFYYVRRGQDKLHVDVGRGHRRLKTLSLFLELPKRSLARVHLLHVRDLPKLALLEQERHELELLVVREQALLAVEDLDGADSKLGWPTMWACASRYVAIVG